MQIQIAQVRECRKTHAGMRTGKGSEGRMLWRRRPWLGRERGQGWASKAGKSHYITPIRCLYVQAAHGALEKARGAHTALPCPMVKGGLPRKLPGWPVIRQELTWVIRNLSELCPGDQDPLNPRTGSASALFYRPTDSGVKPLNLLFSLSPVPQKYLLPFNPSTTAQMPPTTEYEETNTA